MKMSLAVLKKKKKLNKQLPYNPAIVLLGIYPRDMKMCLCKNLYTNVNSSYIYK